MPGRKGGGKGGEREGGEGGEREDRDTLAHAMMKTKRISDEFKPSSHLIGAGSLQTVPDAPGEAEWCPVSPVWPRPVHPRHPTPHEGPGGAQQETHTTSDQHRGETAVLVWCDV